MATEVDRSERQLRLYEFLQQAEESGTLVSTRDICTATGWKAATANTYLGKGLIGSVLMREETGGYRVQGARTLSAESFLRLMTQSRGKQKFGHQYEPVVRELLERSRTNVSLAVEIFNRVNLENRLDAFVLLFISAWEQLLKAELEQAEPGSIFTGEKTRTGRDKTIGFQQCLDRILKTTDPVRRNLETVRSLRDDAAHLLVREVQPVAARYFQAGLANYVDRFHRFTGEHPLTLVGAGLLTLAMPYLRPDIVALRNRYGQATADEVLALVDRLEQEALQENDSQYAVSVRYRLVLTDEPIGASIELAKAPLGNGIPGLIVEKPVDAEGRYPFFETQLTEALCQRTGTKWTQNDVRAVVFYEKWKNADNEYHHHFKRMNRHAYSRACVETITRKFTENANYREQACAAWSQHLAKRRKGRRAR